MGADWRAGHLNHNSRPKAAAEKSELSAEAKALDEFTVALDVDIRQVAEQTTTLTHEKQQTTTRVVVVLVSLEVLGQVFDALGENRNLNLGRTGVTLVSCILFDDVILDSKIKCHSVQSLRFAARCHTRLVKRSLSAAVTRQPHYLISVLAAPYKRWWMSASAD